ncbi:MAG: T9SS type A sorting domain-containing protein [Bacteroidia bacterium]
MKLTKTLLLSFCLVGFGATSLRAQQGQSAAAGEIYGPGGNVSFTIGQSDYVTTTGSGGTILQGVQQPIEIFILSGIEQTDIQLKCAVYPNPATDYVMLSVQGPFTENMTYLLYNMEGKIITSGPLGNNETKISLSQLANSIYYIKVLHNNSEIKTFKIIKNK